MWQLALMLGIRSEPSCLLAPLKSHACDVDVGRRNEMHANVTRDPVAVTAARVALLALRVAAVKDSQIPLDHFFIEPDTTPLTTYEASRELAGRAKPTACHATASPTGLSISCAPIAPGLPTREHQADIDAFENSTVGFLALMRRNEAATNDRILILGLDEAEVVPLAAFSKWYRDYDLPDHVSLGLRSPTPDERSRGVGHVVLMSRGQEL